MKAIAESLVAIISQACPFLIMTASKDDDAASERRGEVTLAQRILIIAMAFLLAGGAAGFTLAWTTGQEMVRFNIIQQARVSKDQEHDTAISAMQAELAVRTEDRYKGSDARRDLEVRDRQIAELRERITVLETMYALRNRKGLQQAP